MADDVVISDVTGVAGLASEIGDAASWLYDKFANDSATQSEPVIAVSADATPATVAAAATGGGGGVPSTLAPAVYNTTISTAPTSQSPSVSESTPKRPFWKNPLTWAVGGAAGVALYFAFRKTARRRPHRR